MSLTVTRCRDPKQLKSKLAKTAKNEHNYLLIMYTMNLHQAQLLCPLLQPDGKCGCCVLGCSTVSECIIGRKVKIR